MTDDEIRRIGQDFINRHTAVLHTMPLAYTAEDIAKFSARWTYADYLRVGVYVLARNAAGCWSIDWDHIQKVCTNTAAFKQAPPADSARVGDMNTAEAPKPLPFMSAQDEADHLESGEPLYIDGVQREPSPDAKRSFELLRSISDDLVVESFSPAADSGLWLDDLIDW